MVRINVESSSTFPYMKTKPKFWEKKSPKRISKVFTALQKRRAKARAKAAGRPYPNLVDNAAVSREKK